MIKIFINKTEKFIQIPHKYDKLIKYLKNYDKTLFNLTDK